MLLHCRWHDSYPKYPHSYISISMIMGQTYTHTSCHDAHRVSCAQLGRHGIAWLITDVHVTCCVISLTDEGGYALVSVLHDTSTCKCAGACRHVSVLCPDMSCHVMLSCRAMRCPCVMCCLPGLSSCFHVFSIVSRYVCQQRGEEHGTHTHQCDDEEQDGERAVTAAVSSCLYVLIDGHVSSASA